MRSLKPGAYVGLTDTEYDDIDAVRSSMLGHFRRTPLHAKYALDHPRTSKSMNIGSALHNLLLWPSRFGERYALAPSQEKRSKKDKDAWAALAQRLPHAEILRPAEWDDVHRMRDAVLRHPLANRLLSAEGQTELTIVWEDEETGLLCKARPDKIVANYVSPWGRGCAAGAAREQEWPTIIDLKSSRDASRWSFEKSINDFGYDVQAAHYLTAAESFKDIERKYVFVVVENTPPYAVAVYELEHAAIDIGRKRQRRYLNQYAAGLRHGEWYGYPEEPDVIGLPSWVYRTEENEQ